MTINDLAFAMVKNKEDEKEIKECEKKIVFWENEKAYPTLEDIYQMAYIIGVKPGELLTIRNRGRKQFYRESDDSPVRKHDWIEISDNASLIFSGIAKLAGLFRIICFLNCIIQICRYVLWKNGKYCRTRSDCATNSKCN